MSERIYEFAESAIEHAVLNPSELNLESSIETEDSQVTISVPKEFIDKFAELIVQECIDICEDTRYDGQVAANRIKFVFGLDTNTK